MQSKPILLALIAAFLKSIFILKICSILNFWGAGQFLSLFKLEGAKLTIKQSAVREIANQAINKKTGARGLRSILENILLKTMFELPSSKNVEEIVVDQSAAKGSTQPITIYSKENNKNKAEKSSAA